MRVNSNTPHVDLVSQSDAFFAARRVGTHQNTYREIIKAARCENESSVAIWSRLFPGDATPKRMYRHLLDFGYNVDASPNPYYVELVRRRLNSVHPFVVLQEEAWLIAIPD